MLGGYACIATALGPISTAFGVIEPDAVADEAIEDLGSSGSEDEGRSLETDRERGMVGGFSISCGL